MVLHHRGFPIRKSADRSLFAAPRSLSQLIASFFGSLCQGIHLMLLFAWTFLFFLSLVLLYELLEFHKTNNLFGCQFSVKRFYPFCFESFFPPFGEIVIYPNLERPSDFFANLLVLNLCVLLSVRFLLFNTLFGFQWTYIQDQLYLRALCSHSLCRSWLSELPTGGLKWTRTTDLALIRRAL